MPSLTTMFVGLGQGLTTLLALWAIGWLTSGDAWMPIRTGLYLAPFLLLVSSALAAAALLTRRPMAGAVAGGIAVLLAAAAPPSLTRLASAPDGPGLRLTTLSNRTRNTDMAATAGAMRAQVADIFVLQEIADPATLIVALTGLYRAGRPPHHCTLGTYLIAARFPVGPAERLPGNVAVRCPVRLPGGDVMVYSVHLPRALREADRQTKALTTLLADAARQAGPVILAGDFNATPLTGTMRRAGELLVNAFDVVGSGPGFTFPTAARRMGRLGPFLRIDHVLVDPEFRPVWARAARWHPPGADHYPVEIGLADLRGLSG